jgi:hypothetical protein
MGDGLFLPLMPPDELKPGDRVLVPAVVKEIAGQSAVLTVEAEIGAGRSDDFCKAVIWHRFAFPLARLMRPAA